MDFKIERKFSTIEEFTRSYISRALEVLLENGGPLVLGEWEYALRKKVSEDIGISEAQIILLHHSLHWTFFSHNSEAISPLNLFHGKGKDSHLYVGLKEEIVPKKIEGLISYIQSEHGPYLKERVSGFNISLQ
jgi:hypothetical protein